MKEKQKTPKAVLDAFQLEQIIKSNRKPIGQLVPLNFGLPITKKSTKKKDNFLSEL